MTAVPRTLGRWDLVLLKIVAIVSLIVVGLVMIIGGFTAPNGATAGFDNLWNDGGFFPTGPMGFVAGFQIAVFAFVGIELVGTTAAEAKDPEKNLPKAINSIPIRVLLFYVAALVVIMAVTPWREIEAGRSPFVAMFTLAGLGIAVADAHPQVRARADWITGHAGGRGAVREVCELLLTAQGRLDEALRRYVTQ